MNKKLVVLITVLSLLAGCRGHGSFMKPPLNSPSDDATIKLAEAASSVSDSMLEMARIEKVIYRAGKDSALAIPNAYNLQARASVDWSGPIEEVTERVANAAHYRLRVLGKAPAIPVLIGLDTRNRDQSLAEILRNIDYMAGKKASLYVYPNSQVIELRYAKTYS